MRIAKNDSVHAIWLKLSKMLRFIVSSMIFIVTGALGRCCQESCKVSRFVSLLRLQILARHTGDRSVERASEIS
jgi:hypothetical protein